MESVYVEKINETNARVKADAGILQEMSEYFTFTVPGAKFMPAVRNRIWDGKIRLLNSMTGIIYAGLTQHIQKFCKDREYKCDLADSFADEEFSIKEAEDFIQTLNLPFPVRDYQLDAFVHAVRSKRAVLLSPTASGKSLIIYLLVRYYNARTLIIVPTVSLVLQLASDFASYGHNVPDDIHTISAGVDKHSDARITISTWQSIYKLPKEYFGSFDVAIGDEAHLFKAKSLTSILEKLTDCGYRFGFTGTLDGSQTHKLVLEGLFGAVRKVTTTAELMEQKHVADFKIKALVLKYPDEIKKQLKGATYQDEIDFIVRNEARNKFIKNLTLSLNGNILILYNYVEKHGKVLYDMISPERDCHFVHGGVDGEERENIRALIETSNNSVIVASYGTFSTGINIKNLHNVIFASPSKSRVRNLQSIGRGLRMSETKSSATLYDIADDLSWKSKQNHTLSHFIERVKIYDEEKFSYKIYTVGLKT